MDKSLDAYRAKRDFSKTPEPAGARRPARGGNSFVIQKHAARRLHYDFRLELNGVLLSWAVPEGPSLVPGKKRLAVHVEDHPLEYGGFEGVIPRGEYGGGTVMVWDRGTWTPEFDPELGLRKGHLRFTLDGEKLKGGWHLVRMAPKPREKQEAWLLFKSDDAAARPAEAPDILDERPESVATGRDMEAIAQAQDRVWSSRRGGPVEPPAAAQRRSKPAVNPAKLRKAKAGPLPPWVEPCLPSPVERAPSGKDWVHEIKYDGYRVQARIEGGRVALLTRQGLDWTARFPGIAPVLAGLPVKAALMDGEIVVQTEDGIASFTALVDVLKQGAGNLVFYGFDLLHLDGFDLRETPLVDRKAALGKIIAEKGDSRIRLSEHLAGDGETIFRHAARLGLEGIVSKLASSPYRSGRSKAWLKLKTALSGTFVIAGYIPSTVDKRAIGALVLGEYANGKLVPSGHVGSGFSAAMARELWQKLDPLRVKAAPLKDETALAKGVKWVEPVLSAEIEYGSRTGSNLIRHAVFRELNEGKDAKDVTRDAAAAAGTLSRQKDAAPAVRLTSPARLLWPEQGITKQGLADFYMEIADWILPHIAGRPLSLLRCPDGVNAQCFFQKHRWAGLGDAVRLVQVPGEDEPMVAIDDLAGLLELVQVSVLEIHPWGAKADRPDLPDRATIDLDPGEGVPWPHVVEAACDVRDRLAAEGLRSFVKTTGGKGLHVVFPLTPGPDWETLKRYTQSIAERMAAERPDRYTANMAKRDRHGRIYVDYLRNGRGATAVGAYSTRARAGAAVSTPLSWDELGPGIRSNHFTLANLAKRLAFLDADPWEGFLSLRQNLPVSTAKPAKRSASRPVGETLPDAIVPPKARLAAYWKKVAKHALPVLGRRPLRLVRHENGVTFFHKGELPPLPDTVHQISIRNPDGGEEIWPWVDSLDGLLGLVEIGTVELHPWGATVDDIEHPDTLVFALEGASPARVIEAALKLRDVLRGEELECWPMLTGDKGLHVVAPVEPDLDWQEMHAYSQAIAERVAGVNGCYNTRGATAIGAWSPRARPGFPVAAPASWPALQRGIAPDAFTLTRPPKPS